MLPIRTHKQFEKDLKLSIKRGKKIDKIWVVIELLQKDLPLPPKCRSHKLTGEWNNF